MKKLITLAALVLGCCFLFKAQSQPTGAFPGPGGHASEPAATGFYGQTLAFNAGGPVLDGQPPAQGHPVRTYLTVYNADGKLIRRMASNPVGQFYAYFVAGSYTLVATLPGQSFPPKLLSQYVPPSNTHSFVAAPIPVTVISNQLTSVEIDYTIGHD